MKQAKLTGLVHELSLDDALRFRRSMKYTFGKESRFFHTSTQELLEMGTGTMYYFTFLKLFAVYGLVSTLVMLPSFGLFLRGEGIPLTRRDGLGLAVLSYGSLGLGADSSASLNDTLVCADHPAVCSGEMARGPGEDEWTDSHAVAQLVSFSDLACSALFFVALLTCHQWLKDQEKQEFERRSQAIDYSVFVEGLPSHASENQVLAFFSNQYDCSRGHREWPMHCGCLGVRAPQSSESAEYDPVVGHYREGRLAPVSDLQHCCEDQRYNDAWVAEVTLCTRKPPLLQLRSVYARLRTLVVDLQRQISNEKAKALDHEDDMQHSHLESAAAHRLAEANDFMSDHRTKWLNRAACETELQRVMREELYPLDAKMTTLAQLHEQWRRLSLYRRDYGLRASAVRTQQRNEAQTAQQRPKDADVTGAFVVFNNSLSRALCLHDYRYSAQWAHRMLQPPGLRFKDLDGKCYPLRVTPAPGPSEVIWGEHLDTTSWGGVVMVARRRAVGNMLLLVILVGSVAAAYMMGSGRGDSDDGFGADDSVSNSSNSNSSSDIFFPDDGRYGGDVVLMQAVGVLCFNLLLEFVASPAARVQSATSTAAPSSTNPFTILMRLVWSLRGAGYGGYASTTALAESTSQKLFASELLNTVAVALLVSVLGRDTNEGAADDAGCKDGGVRWLGSAGATIAAASVSLAALPLLKAACALIADWWSVCRVKWALRRRKRDKRGEGKHVQGVHNQAELNELVSPPRFELHGRYPAVAVALFVAVVLGGAIPFLYPALALVCTVSFLVDRTLLLEACGHAPPPQLAVPSADDASSLPRAQPHDLRSARMCVQLLPYALLMRTCVAIWIHSSPEIWAYSNGKIRFAAASSTELGLDVGRLAWPTVFPHLVLGGMVLLWIFAAQLRVVLDFVWFLPSVCLVHCASPDSAPAGNDGSGGDIGELITAGGNSTDGSAAASGDEDSAPQPQLQLHPHHPNNDAHAQHHIFVKHLALTALAHSPYSLGYKQRLDPRHQRQPLSEEEVLQGWCYHTETEDWEREQVLRRKRDEEAKADETALIAAGPLKIGLGGGGRESVRVVERALGEARAKGGREGSGGMRRLLGGRKQLSNKAGAGASGGDGALTGIDVAMLVEIPTPAIAVAAAPAKSEFGPPVALLMTATPAAAAIAAAGDRAGVTPGKEASAEASKEGVVAGPGANKITPGPGTLITLGMERRTSPALGSRRRDRAHVYLVLDDSSSTFRELRRCSVDLGDRRPSKEILPPLAATAPTRTIALIAPGGSMQQSVQQGKAHRWEWRKDCIAMADSIAHSLEHHMRQKGEANVAEEPGGGRRKSVVEELQELERGLVEEQAKRRGSTKATLAEKLEALEVEKALKEENEKAARNKRAEELARPTHLTWQLMQGVPSYRMHRHPAIRPLVLLSPFLRQMEDEQDPNAVKGPGKPKRKQSVSNLPVERRRSLREDWSKAAAPDATLGEITVEKEKERAARAAGLVRASEVCVDDEHMSTFGAFSWIIYHAVIRPIFGGARSNVDKNGNPLPIRRGSVFSRKSSTDKIHVEDEGAAGGQNEEAEATKKAMQSIKNEVESRIPTTSDLLHEPQDGETLLRLTVCQARGLVPWKKPGADNGNALTKRKGSVATAQFEGTYVAVSCANRNKKTDVRYLTNEPRWEHTFEFDVTKHLARPDDHPDGKQACKVAVWMQDSSTQHGSAGTGDKDHGGDNWVGDVVLPLKSLKEGFVKGSWRQGIDSRAVEEGSRQWHKIYRSFTEHAVAAVTDKSQIKTDEAKAMELAGLKSNGVKSIEAGEVLLKFGFVSKVAKQALTWRDAEAQRLVAQAEAGRGGRKPSGAEDKEQEEAMRLLRKPDTEEAKEEAKVGGKSTKGPSAPVGKGAKGTRKQSAERTKITTVRKKDKGKIPAQKSTPKPKPGTSKPTSKPDPEVDPYDGSYAPMLEGWVQEWDAGKGGWYYWKEVFGEAPETSWERPVNHGMVRRRSINERKAKQMEELFNDNTVNKAGETQDIVEQRLSNRRKSVLEKEQAESEKEEKLVAYRKKQQKLEWAREKNEREWHISSNRAEVAQQLAAKHRQREADEKSGVKRADPSKSGRKGSGTVHTWDYKRAMQETESAVASAKKELAE
jgi:hypothetical protein